MLPSLSNCYCGAGCTAVIMAPKLWNSLPDKIRSIKDYAKFKKDLKTFNVLINTLQLTLESDI